MTNYETSELLSAINSIYKYLLAGDYNSLIKKISKDINGIGTNEDEICNSLNEFQTHILSQFTQQKTENIQLKLDIGQYNIKLIDDNTGYFMSNGEQKISSPEGEFNIPVRTTFILKKENEIWKLCHYHWSFPFTGAEENTPFPKFNKISENISNWLKALELDTSQTYMNDQDRKNQLVEYLKKAKVILDTMESS